MRSGHWHRLRFHKRWWARKGCFKNGDLWSRIGAALNRRRNVVVYKVKAHVLAPDSLLDLAAHTWTSVVGNEFADAFAEKGALLHEVPVDVVEASARPTLLRSAFRSSFTPQPYRPSPELKGSAKAPDLREARKLTLPKMMAATAHDLLRDPLKLQGQWHCSRCGHTIAHKHLREWLMNVPCVPLLHTAVPDLFHAGQLALIGLQATHGSHKLAYKRGIWWCVACGSWAPLSSPKFEQALYRPTYKGSAGRSGTLGQGTHTATPRPVAGSAPLVVLLCGLGCGIRLETRGAEPRIEQQRFGVIRMKIPGARRRTALELLQFCCSCDFFGGTTHWGVSALTRIPSSLKRDKIIIISIAPFVHNRFT